ncbi:MAG: efflux RND transporter periplasmic adaptor subunit [Oscillatoriales cyanobacterium RM2_1_1]|nr:efflux RND transporter periplasmic adaptor subunit [Oscillatoriales cyanobacterium SM2_3_0]NJO46996.1 efflux RND transporter periplasmic adaptor subunit [Oscillatoriales cyanobacterium RM2_1_1]
MTPTSPTSSDSQPLSQPEFQESQNSQDIFELQDSLEVQELVQASAEPQDSLETAEVGPRNRWLGFLLTALALGGGLVGWQLIQGAESEPALSQAQTPPPRPITLTRLQGGDPVRELKLIGQVEASEQATIRSQVDGAVQQVLVKVGDRLTPGATVAILDNTDQQLALREAEAQLATEQSQLAELEAGTRSEILRQRQAELQAAISREQEARDLLQKTRELDPKLMAQRQAELQAAVAREQEARQNLKPARELAPKQIAQRQAELQSAIAREQEARDNLKRVSSLVESGVQSQRVLVEVQSAVDRAVAERLAAESTVTATENETQQDLIAAQARIDTAVSDRLKAEAVLATADTENQRNIASARAALDTAIQERLGIEAELSEAKAGPRAEEIAAQQSVVKAAAAAVNQARVNLQRTEIKSPTAGVVRSRAVSVSDYVESSDPILTLVSDEKLDVFLEVPEAVSGQVIPGIPVELTTRALPEWRQVSQITAVVPATDSTSRRQIVRVNLENPPEGLLPGMAVQGELQLPIAGVNPQETNFTVPRDALVRQGDRWLLFTVVDSKAQQVDVEVLADLGENVVIANGNLREGQAVVLRGGDGLKDGGPVKVVEE